MDIDQTCVTMAQVNMMLYGLNGVSLHSALTATPRQLASLPEPLQQAYALAQEAQAAGNTDLVAEIADTLRVQQALFDVDQFTQSPDATGIGGQRTASRPRATVQRPRPQPEAAQLIEWRDESPSLPFGGL
jgi:hypothetical protein